ncbi:MAG TPA: class I SAM-dependent methyltransferase [Solimonas sp.]
MSELGRHILQHRRVEDASGQVYELNAETGLSQCQFIADLLRAAQARRYLEIGLAYGLSALFAAEVLAQQPEARLIAIDPFQRQWYRGVALTNLEREGRSHFVEFHEDYSFNVLPQLLQRGETLDAAYIDSTKVFDYLLVDAFYLSRLLRVGGLLILDDCSLPSIQRLARYLARWPHLRVHSTHGEYRTGIARRLAAHAAALIPKAARLFADDVVTPSDRLGTQANCVVFEKVAEDARPYNWSAPL